MATLNITGTAEQLLLLSGKIKAAVAESKSPRSVTVTFDNNPGLGTFSVQSSGGVVKKG